MEPLPPTSEGLLRVYVCAWARVRPRVCPQVVDCVNVTKMSFGNSTAVLLYRLLCVRKDCLHTLG